MAGVTFDELNAWAAALERTGCIGAGEAFTLTTSVIDALPLGLSERRQLRGEALATRGSVDLSSVNALRVVSPVFRPGAPPGTAIATEQSEVSGGPNGSITVELKANPDLTGYEVAWYDVRKREDGPGFHIAPRTAEVHIAGKVEQEPAPRVNPFVFEPTARWFRFFLITRASANDYDMVLLSAPTASDLEARTELFRRDAAGYLRSADKATYAAMTREIGVNPYVRVRVNGVETDIPVGDSIRQVIEASTGRGQAANALPHLTILKPHGGKLCRVEWDHSARDILSLTLEGGEEIAW
jgi:hypothetical protein